MEMGIIPSAIFNNLDTYTRSATPLYSMQEKTERASSYTNASKHPKIVNSLFKRPSLTYFQIN